LLAAGQTPGYVADAAVAELGKPGYGLVEQMFDRGGVGTAVDGAAFGPTLGFVPGGVLGNRRHKAGDWQRPTDLEFASLVLTLAFS